MGKKIFTIQPIHMVYSFYFQRFQLRSVSKLATATADAALFPLD